jgi:hypothetical protein
MEDDTTQFDAMAIDRPVKQSASRQYEGRAYAWETSDVYAARAQVAAKYIDEGLTSKHAWYKAFQEHPRVYLDDAAPAPAPSADDCDAGKSFFKSRV